MTEPDPRGESELGELIASIEVSAPAELQQRVQAMIERAATRRSAPAGQAARIRLGLGAALLAGILLAALLAIGGSGSQPSVGQAAALALSAPRSAAPGERPGSPPTLGISIDGIAFPYWAGRLGWRARGSRLDRRGGQSIRTVFYSGPAGRQVGYAIVAGAAPALPGPTSYERDGVSFHLSRLDGAPVISWLREGHLCVLAGRGVTPAELVTLASWGDPS